MSKDCSTESVEAAAVGAADPRPRTVFGIDSHARTTTVCALEVGTGATTTRTFRGNPYARMRAWMAAFPGPSVGVYEAGCTGFVPARELTREGVAVVPIAPSKMPSSAESRTRKNDRNDAARLARLAAAGELSEVWVPPVEVEGLRDLVRALDDLADQRDRARRRVEAILCRHGLVWDGRTPAGRPKRAWGAEFLAWARGAELPDPCSRAALLAALRAAESASEQLAELERQARGLAAASPLAGTVEALCCLKCVRFATALAFCAQVGDFSRFGSGRRVTSYLGLAPREGSSGLERRVGAITRCGNRSLRSLLVECAWSATRCRPALAKACPATVDPRVRERARTLSLRLCEHRRSMIERGVPACKANAATAAELGRFMYFLGRDQQAVEAEARSA